MGYLILTLKSSKNQIIMYHYHGNCIIRLARLLMYNIISVHLLTVSNLIPCITLSLLLNLLNYKSLLTRLKYIHTYIHTSSSDLLEKLTHKKESFVYQTLSKQVMNSVLVCFSQHEDTYPVSQGAASLTVTAKSS